jgi:pimeloyl-ACP methyl ester carboxylesterase
MGSIIFVPGILGSELFLDGEMVWPPTAAEAMFGYGRIDKLAHDRVKPGAPIAKVCIKAIYEPLLEDLAAIAKGGGGAPKRRFHPMGYDWRRDIRDASTVIAARIDALPAADRSEIMLVGHSMGCLVLRFILESGDFDQKSWFAAIKSFVALAGPHRGAPMALVRALGMEGSVGLSPTDIQRLAADPRFPSVYQLLPAPGLVALWRGLGPKIEPLDFYKASVANELGLSKVNLTKAKELHTVLAKQRRPAHVAYLHLAGTGHGTTLRVDHLDGMRIQRAGEDAGDGTVPLWSAVDPALPNFAAPGAHDSVFTNDSLRALVFRALGSSVPTLGISEATADALAIDISTAAVTLPVDEPFELLLVPRAPRERIDGAVKIRRLDPVTEKPARAATVVLPLKLEAGALTFLKLQVPAIAKVGLYEAVFVGKAADETGRPARFAISAVK